MGIAFLIVAAIIVVGFSRYRTKARLELAASREGGRIEHLRTGAYPSSCSWCKITTLASKLVVFERTKGNWRAADVIENLRTCSPAEVEHFAALTLTNQPQWRRFCSERCTKEFFAVEHVQAVEEFSCCEYCSSRSPATLTRCPNCGAARR